MALNDYYALSSRDVFDQFDKIIDVQFMLPPTSRTVNKQWGTVIVKCGTGGLKPGISFSAEILPGGVATQFKLSITNFTAEVDIGLFSHMIITVGYRTMKLTRQFSATIFSAYIETPNPNGITTFTGLVGDWFISNLQEASRSIVFKKPIVTVGELLWGIVEGKGPDGREESPNIKGGGLGLTLEVDLPREILQDKLVVGKEGQKESTYWTESGYACLNWLLDRLSAYGDSVVNGIISQGKSKGEDLFERAEKFRILATLQDNVVVVFMKGFTQSLDTRKIRYVDLSRVTSITFQGAALSIIAPWNPLVMPGSLIHMESRYFRGRMSPQQVIRTAARDKADLYRVITMSVDYDTNGTRNSMKLLAIRNEAFVGMETGAEPYTAVSKEMDIKTNVYKNDNNTPDIVFGEDRRLEPGEKTADWGITKDTFNIDDGIIREVRPGDTLGSLASSMYGSLKYYKQLEEGNLDHINEYVPGEYFWPIIVIGNYCMKLKGEEGFDSYTQAPLQLKERQRVFLPVFLYLGELAPKIKTILQNMSDHFKNNKDNTWSVTDVDIQYLDLICYFMELES